jgi:hypothetical protein
VGRQLHATLLKECTLPYANEAIEPPENLQIALLDIIGPNMADIGSCRTVYMA